ncbi:transposase [Streptomyces sp. NPDC054933]
MPQLNGPAWVGIDAGGAAHHVAVADATGEVVWSTQVANDQAAIEEAITAAFARHPQAKVITRMFGMGPQLGAEFVIATGDLSTLRDVGHPASYAGLAPVARDSGRITGNLHKPKRYHRRLRRVFYLAALSSLKTNGSSREYYLRKRAEDRKHQQALMALARRLVDRLRALVRDNRISTPAPPTAQTA